MQVKQWKGLEEEALLILQPFHCFTYVAAHSPHLPTLPSLHLHHKFIIQPFCRFIYVSTCSPILLSLHLRHMHVICVTWRAAHEPDPPQNQILDTPLSSAVEQERLTRECKCRWGEGGIGGLMDVESMGGDSIPTRPPITSQACTQHPLTPSYSTLAPAAHSLISLFYSTTEEGHSAGLKTSPPFPIYSLQA